MDQVLKILVAVACIAIIATSGLYFYKEKKALDQADFQRQAAKMALLDREKCSSMAEATIPSAPGKQPKTTQYIQDLKMCEQMNLLGAYEQHQLQLAGLL